MMDREAIQQKAERFFEELWTKADAWGLDSSPFEQARYDALMSKLQGRHYGRVLEIGSGAGAFTNRLVPLADSVLAIDISQTAISKAEQRLGGLDQVTFRAANIMEFEVGEYGPFDLIVFSETIYYLGWLYPFFDIGWLASQLHDATTQGGRLLLANTIGVPGDYLLMPWFVRTYHDLFRNLGYFVEGESTFRGIKDNTPIEVLISVFYRDGDT
jgi:cyclopropane fatty-acyl-phospholipid synthase-like methyltransferase